MKKDAQGNSGGKGLAGTTVLAGALLIAAAILGVWTMRLARADGAEAGAEEPAESCEGRPGPEDTGTAEETEKWQEGVVSYNGQRYRYRASVRTYLFMGIDRAGPVEPAEDGASGGQSDALFLLVADKDRELLSVVAVNRNAMAEVDMYDENGRFVTRRQLPICLQHSYGDGMRLSCSRSEKAVSRLFYGIPLSGYCALNMDGIPILNDLLGGVTVTVEQDWSSESLGLSLKTGDTVTLDGPEAYAFLRSRDTSEFDSATRRLERQKQYLSGLIAKAELLGTGELPAVYDALSDYLVSSIDFAELAQTIRDYEFNPRGIYSVPGRMRMGITYEEYDVDDEALYEMVLELFYEPLE